MVPFFIGHLIGVPESSGLKAKQRPIREIGRPLATFLHVVSIGINNRSHTCDPFRKNVIQFLLCNLVIFKFKSDAVLLTNRPNKKIKLNRIFSVSSYLHRCFHHLPLNRSSDLGFNLHSISIWIDPKMQLWCDNWMVENVKSTIQSPIILWLHFLDQFTSVQQTPETHNIHITNGVNTDPPMRITRCAAWAR
jgi:hypothetical protein